MGAVMRHLVICISTLVVLMGCSSNNSGIDAPHPESLTPDNSANELASVGSGLDGPWGEAFQNAMERTESEKAKQVLADGIITAAERNEIQEDFRKCGKPLGIKDARFLPNQGYEIMFDETLINKDADNLDEQRDKADEYQALCEKETGVTLIEELYFRAGSNPDNVDTSEGIVECLKAEGIVSDSYSLEDYKLDSRTGNIPLIPIDDPLIVGDETRGQIEYTAHYFASICEQDPFGHLGLRDFDWFSPWDS